MNVRGRIGVGEYWIDGISNSYPGVSDQDGYQANARSYSLKRINWLGIVVSLLTAALTGGQAPVCAAETAVLPFYLADRGDGIHTSLFGTYVREHELLFYPFYEYTRTSDFEYKPSELGFSGDVDFFGKADEHEFLVFFAYGFSKSLMVEFESALYSTVTFHKASDDTSAVPNRIRESGVGDTEVQIRWRWLQETVGRPEALFFLKTVFPLQKNKKLLGTQDWEFVPGIALTKGFPFGTFSLSGSLLYSTGEHKLEIGGYALEYVKRLSPAWRMVLAFESEQDERQIIGEVQYAVSKNVMLKVNSGFGLTKKAPDVAPEIGVLFSFPVKKS
jgi:outer membrane putative beta-barrel porin/alpha-amylase